MDLFSATDNSTQPGFRPLAERLRPKTLDDFVGQRKILGPQSSLRKQIEESKIVPNLILWGPPGTGKTTFSRILAHYIEAEFLEVSAVDTGAKALKQLGEEARFRRLGHHRKTLLFVDEIHRLNKAQQDVLLPYTERGDFILVGATTENPAYELNSALMSRCRLLVFESLPQDELAKLVDRAFEFLQISKEQVLSSDAERLLVSSADGDARRLIGWIEQATEVFGLDSQTHQDFPLSGEGVWEICSRSPIRYDRQGDAHYDCISAFIKSIRGSDPDAGLYYLARMLAGGEDPVFIARRLIILASEDVGNGDPRALSVAVAGIQAVEAIGLPECAINLAQVVTYLACAPKSNRSYQGLKRAQSFVAETGTLPIPTSLRSANTRLEKDLGFGKDYRYSHDGPTGWLEQSFLPEKAQGQVFYEPSGRGFEKTMAQYLEWMKQK
ncbi:MAG: replication-associated recombination protein A [Bdellovibrionaceae bacterium]|nr:replication-associated recombination protein A [Bdellovibrionales bacterium]MCB9086085.1 replication-associated recombination protein A [Pseudobdellovibrionaceae bacterium]